MLTRLILITATIGSTVAFVSPSPAQEQELSVSFELHNPSVMQVKVIDPEPAAHDAMVPVSSDLETSFPELNAPQFPAPTYGVEMLTAFKPIAEAAFGLREADVQEMRMIDLGGEKLIAIGMPDGEKVVRLQPFTMRAPDAKLLVQVAGGELVESPWPVPATYRGVIDEMNADVAASIDESGSVSMIILPRNGDDTWVVQPIADALDWLPPGLHAVYRSSDVLPINATCGVTDVMGHPHPANPVQEPLANRIMQQLPPMHPDADKGDGGGISMADGGISAANVRADLGMDADVEFYQANGSSINATVYDMELIMNQVGLIYQNQVAISYVYRGTIVRTVEPDPYNSTNVNTLICEFGNWWNGNVSFTHDVAHLFTGKDLDGTTVGYAWIGAVCAGNFTNCVPNPGSAVDYGLVQSRFSTTLSSRIQDSAHELGHNWNGCHCNTGGNCGGGTSNPACGIMTSNISGQLTFDSAAVTAITGYRDSRTCLEAWQNPTYVNWAYNGVETGSFSQPWNTMLEGVNGAFYGGEIRAQAGNYLQNIFINKVVTIRAENGTVRIGN